ncbi:ferritin-like protein [Flavobacterium sp. ZT3R18]|uniref:ferritin-like domain-containing protein n=1 Tax=Flavobacterium sp. ZT3R18 TaxID=2594429 RepID=UPI00163DC40D|nr:ferritin-like protein [Flavobacterium sp. ZT3R18]
MKLELSTIPPYLCGLYTIKEGSNVEAAGLIRSVVVEEMLHMILVANILNAITDPKTIKKGDTLFNVKEIIPSYPTPLPGGIVPEVPKGMPPFEVQLLRFSREALEEFATIERPSDPKAPITKNFDSIGQFYESIRYGLLRLNETTPGGIFIGDPKRQIAPEHYYGSGGKITKVITYEDAEEAIGEIVGQGEGIDGTITTEHVLFGENIEYAHYFKFQEISYGRMYSANDTNFQMPVRSVPTGRPFAISWSSVYNMKANPKNERL